MERGIDSDDLPDNLNVNLDVARIWRRCVSDGGQIAANSINTKNAACRTVSLIDAPPAGRLAPRTNLRTN